MNLSERRRDNLNQWFELLMQDHFKTGKAICEHYGLEASEISQLLNSHRPFGKKTARLLEQKLQLPDGALDLDTMTAQLSLNDIRPEVALKAVVKMALHSYEMVDLQQQAFRLQACVVSLNLTQSLNKQAKDNLFSIRVVGSYYEPLLNVGWTVLCDRAEEVQAQDWVCVKLVNELCLFLQLLHQTQTQHHFQSLDRLKTVSFECSDVVSVDLIVMIETRRESR